MSMSQEEIEALMNGIDLDDSGDKESDELVEEKSSQTLSTDEIESLINEASPNVDDDLSSEVSNDDIEALLATIEGVKGDESLSQNNIESKAVASSSDAEIEKVASDWASKKLEEGVIPYPVTNDHKPINQLSEVAHDSEEKATRIFDVLSFILDENNYIQQESKKLDEFLNKQVALMEALSSKFPNIDVFKNNHQAALELKGNIGLINSKIDAENMQLFEAMELMQFHDINRQKIERVMAVIRKLSRYLNNLFEDDGSHKEVAVAKHIHGDVNNDVVGGDDLEALIAEFNKG